MTEYKHRARKRFGQNFLQDQSVIRNIALAVRPRDGDRLVEIGPGQGALTDALLQFGCPLDVVELDRDLIPLLNDRFGANPLFQIHEGDALKFDFNQLGDDQPLRIVGNLPYNISTPLLFKLLSLGGKVKDLHFMLQKEVVQRLAAQPGTKAWGRLGAMAQYLCQVEDLFDVPPGAFRPIPKVMSAVVRLVPHAQRPVTAKDLTTLDKVMRIAFSQRRKTLRNVLRDVLSVEELEALGIDAVRRPDTLSVAELVAMADHVFDRGDSDRIGLIETEEV